VEPVGESKNNAVMITIDTRNNVVDMADAFRCGTVGTAGTPGSVRGDGVAGADGNPRG
jgi:hypothetical protein